jgi:hypothetical protein
MKSPHVLLLALLLPDAGLVPATGVAADSPPKQAAPPVVFSDAEAARMEKAGDMESFVLAETFKYFYLLFAPPQTLDPGKVVLRTEAHPILPTWADR